ncbi:hypothetical protein M432DRAFT_615368 [Thermoascus aurantiacus ATCC 26904]
MMKLLTLSLLLPIITIIISLWPSRVLGLVCTQPGQTFCWGQDFYTCATTGEIVHMGACQPGTECRVIPETGAVVCQEK